MKKVAWVGTAVGALVLAGLANAATVRGVVVAREAASHTLVVSSTTGAVTTVRVTAEQSRKTRLGTRLTATGARLSDGSVDVNRLVPTGEAERARLSVVVVKARRQRLLVAGGGSAFALRLRAGARVLADSTPQLQPGDKVETEVEIGDDGIVGTVVQQVGQTPVIEFTGTVAAVAADAVTIDSDGTATVVRLPAGVTLPTVVTVGARVEVVATISGTALTLATIEVDGDDAARPGDQGTQVDDNGEVEVEGAITALGGGMITIQPGGGAVPLVFAVPPTIAIPSSLAAGSRVDARGEMVAGLLTLTRLEVKGGSDGDSSPSTTTSGSGDDGSSAEPAASGDDGSGESGSGGDDGSASGSGDESR